MNDLYHIDDDEFQIRGVTASKIGEYTHLVKRKVKYRADYLLVRIMSDRIRK